LLLSILLSRSAPRKLASDLTLHMAATKQLLINGNVPWQTSVGTNFTL
jgi:hypothetical protein